MRNRPSLFGAALVATATALIALPATVSAHVERTSYWPDPKPDTSVKPAAGGEVPTARPLATALDSKPAGYTRVVCQSDSYRRANGSIAVARTKGFRDRPSESLQKLTLQQGRALRKLNKRLFKACRYHEIQPAVNRSKNNDRIVLMPGVYSEPASRAVPNFPPECDKYRTESDHGSGAVSYAYQSHCPNAQALVAVLGRAPDTGPEPQSSLTGRPDPHGIPNEGACIRCNMQIEGSGVTADDVVIDAGRVASGNGAPIEPKKDVGLKIDRADGIVLRDFTVRHVGEHGVYILETDGYLMSRMKYFYAIEYGALMFASDHGLTDVCEGVGNGDSAVYPGGAPDTGTRRDTKFYPEQRLNNTITHCDLHHNNLGYSGTMGNATHVIDNNFYDNTTAIATDSFFAGGHPGFPQDSAVFERNRIYSNNFNIYAPDSDIKSTVGVPIGVGILIAGGDDDVVRDNVIYDNWRRGTMLLAVPDVISCAPSGTTPACTPEGAATTSNGNRYTNNVMGRTADGKALPNGVDFWWDEFPTNAGNCWYPNTGSNGKPDGITSDPPPPPTPGTNAPRFLPQGCGQPGDTGTGNPSKEAILVACAESSIGDGSVCDWYQMPERPGTPAAARQNAENQRTADALVGKVQPDRFCNLLGGEGGSLTCGPFRSRV